MVVADLAELIEEMRSIRDEVPLKAVVNSRLRNHGESFETMSKRGLEQLAENSDLPLQVLDFTRDLSALEIFRRQ